uniref:Glutathione transferase n=1 Tax=Neogobius melanostomus TaxID=47308 RepID=A0A8C6TIZ5_9GOBI
MAKDMTLFWGSGSPPAGGSSLLWRRKGNKRPTKVPAFQHGNLIINESIGICEYLEDRFKDIGTKLVPEDCAEKAMMFQRMHEGNSLMMKFGDFAFYNWKVPEPERHDSALKRNQEALTAEMQLWEDYLKKSNGQYLTGKNFTLADVVNFPVIAMIFRMGLCEEKYPTLAKYYNDLKDRPALKIPGLQTGRTHRAKQFSTLCNIAALSTFLH